MTRYPRIQPNGNVDQPSRTLTTRRQLLPHPIPSTYTTSVTSAQVETTAID